MRPYLVMLACSCVLSGCARHVPHPASLAGEPNRCRLPVLKLTANEFDNPDEGMGLTYRGPDRGASLVGVIDGEAATAPAAATRDTVLVLSGGGPHGAFGAGLFYGWMNAAAREGEPVPTYKIVTGVSTGALQSTFIFLATARSASSREGAQRERDRLRAIPFLAKRMDKPAGPVAAPGSSYLATLVQDYMPDEEGDLLHLHPLQRMSPNKGGMLELVGRSSLATMTPLRRLIDAQIGDETLAGVAAEAREGRKLFVAMTDLTNGYGYAADLTLLAKLAADPVTSDEDRADVRLAFPRAKTREDRLAAARRCYTDALIASSTVPPGVPAVPIGIIRVKKDGHLASPDYDPRDPRPEIPTNRVVAEHAFIDGGAAFAVFFSQLGDQLAGLNDVDMDLVVNGSYYPQEWSKWLNAKGRTVGIKNVRLSSADVLLQSAEIVQAQIRLFSVQEARRWAAPRGRFRWAFIDNREIASGAGGPDMMKPWGKPFAGTPLTWRYAPPGEAEQDCATWRDSDRRKRNPMEFYPSYMRCVVSYGIRRGEDRQHRWNLCEAKDPRRCVSASEDGRLPED